MVHLLLHQTKNNLIHIIVMTRAIQIKTILFLGAVVLLINGCKKDGATGPQGPAGQNGHTNVFSNTYTMSSWSYITPHYYMNLSVPELTVNNIDSSLVMVYFSTTGSNWFALPYTQYNSPSDYYMGFASSSGNVQVTWVYDSSLSTGSDPNTYYGTTIKCKVVVIPRAMKQPHINHMNYEEVKTSYSLKD